ncbi:MAG: hypothetical protein M1834_004818 [Cirrosporium novae-zelandiae]|nr:MAG: hypothetical protein M1834_004818 [Cirrosporium novae-zelandiae]
MTTSSSSDSSCPALPTSDPKPVINGMTFQHVAAIASLACTVWTTLVFFFLLNRHLLRYAVGDEQRQIVRIIATPVIFSLISLLMILFYSSALYIDPIRDTYEAIALVSLFLLYVNYLVPRGEDRLKCFYNFDRKNKAGEIIPGGSLKWFKYIISKIILMAAQMITEAAGIYCETSNKIRYGHIWIKVIGILVTIIAVMSVVRFYSQLKAELAGHRPLLKLIAFKLIVFLDLVQTSIFTFLASSDDNSLSSKFTYQDLTIGLPCLLTSIEMALFALAFIYVFNTADYKSKTRSSPPLPYFQAFADAMNPSDLLIGIYDAFLFLSQRSGTEDMPASKYPPPNRGSPLERLIPGATDRTDYDINHMSPPPSYISAARR